MAKAEAYIMPYVDGTWEVAVMRDGEPRIVSARPTTRALAQEEADRFNAGDASLYGDTISEEVQVEFVRAHGWRGIFRL
jgi:hypothetical protein